LGREAIATNEIERPQRFHASLFWTANLFVGFTVGLGGVTIMELLRLHSDPSLTTRELWIFGISIFLGLLAWFPGNLRVFWPYAVEVDSKVGLTLHGPFKKVFIPIADVGWVEDSFFWQGKVVELKKPHAALAAFVIPWYFGSQRKELVRAIESAIEQRDLRDEAR
jgi:hypothetical protein